MIAKLQFLTLIFICLALVILLRGIGVVAAFAVCAFAVRHFNGKMFRNHSLTYNPFLLQLIVPNIILLIFWTTSSQEAVQTIAQSLAKFPLLTMPADRAVLALEPGDMQYEVLRSKLLANVSHRRYFLNDYGAILIAAVSALVLYAILLPYVYLRAAYSLNSYKRYEAYKPKSSFKVEFPIILVSAVFLIFDTLFLSHTIGLTTYFPISSWQFPLLILLFYAEVCGVRHSQKTNSMTLKVDKTSANFD